MSKVSICIPAYNNPAGIERLLKSIEGQSYRDFEIIITDDSTDERVKMVVDNSPLTIIYEKNTIHDGSTANWNKAINLAKGDYIKIMHHDDWFNGKDSLKELVDLLDSNADAVLAFSGTLQVNGENSYTRFTSPEEAELVSNNWKNLFLGNTFGAPSSVIHRVGDKRYDTNLKWLVDMEFYMQLLKDGGKFVYTEKPLIAIGMSDEQITQGCISNKELNWFEYKYVFKKYGLETDSCYCKKLFDTLLLFDCPVSEIEDTGLDKKEYKKAQLRKLGRKIKDKLHAF